MVDIKALHHSGDGSPSKSPPWPRRTRASHQLSVRPAGPKAHRLPVAATSSGGDIGHGRTDIGLTGTADTRTTPGRPRPQPYPVPTLSHLFNTVTRAACLPECHGSKVFP